MILIKLKGGLGNQMFQYAIGRTLSIRNNTLLCLDVTELNDKSKSHTIRNYELNNFSIKANISTDSYITYQKKVIGLFVTLLNPFLKKKILKRVIEKRFNYDSTINSCSDNSYLIGYWNSPKYFNEYADIIKKDFSFGLNLDDSDNKIAEKIRSTYSVFIHIRRGDYITNSETNAYHGVCGIEYYNKAVDIILEKNRNVIFFIFTDDPEWVKENFRVNAEFYIVSSESNSNTFRDLYLMTLCKNAIIANSTYSWWAAWLIENHDKIVIAPLKWYANNLIDITDLFPSSWIRI